MKAARPVRRCGPGKQTTRKDRTAPRPDPYHIPPWAQGGETKIEWLIMGCTRHHHIFHTPGWTLKLQPDGTLEITDPHGRTYHSRPPGRPPDLFNSSG